MTLSATVTNNNISGFGDAVDMIGTSELFNEWGNTVSNITYTVQNNDLTAAYDVAWSNGVTYAYGDGVYGYFWTSAEFSDYFPPYEQVVSDFATMNFMVDVQNNLILAGDEGVTSRPVEKPGDQQRIILNGLAGIERASDRQRQHHQCG